MRNATITNLSFVSAAEDEIKADFNGVTFSNIPAKAGNRYYDAIQKQIADATISAIPSYTNPVMQMDELRQYRTEDMNIVAMQKANASQYNNMSAGDQTLTDDWHQDMRDLPALQATIDGIAILDAGDKAGALLLLTTKPAILA